MSWVQGPIQVLFGIPAIRGMWIIEADPAQRIVQVTTYQTYSDPGGSVPAFVIHGAYVDQVIKSLEIPTARITNQYGSGPHQQTTSSVSMSHTAL